MRNVSSLLKIRRFIRAFTLIELLVVVSIIGLISALAVTNYSRTKIISRDSQRKSNLQSYADAMELYKIGNASYFVQAQAGGRNCVPSIALDDASDTPAVGTDCVGANGRSYGAINLLSTTTKQAGLSNRTYPAKSIAQALVEGGYLTKPGKDPLNTNGANNDPALRDYYLVKCCAGGLQNPNVSGSLYAIWARLEASPTDNDRSAQKYLCGGLYGAAYQGTTYDFGAQSFDNNQSGTNGTGFAVGNGAIKVSLGGKCQQQVAFDSKLLTDKN